MSSVVEHPAASPPAVDVEDPAATLADCLTFAQVAAAYRVAVIRVGRWGSRGVAGSDGTRRRLPFFRVGRMRYVRRSDLAAFMEDANAAR